MKNITLQIVFLILYLQCSALTYASDLSGTWRDDQPCAHEGLGAHYAISLKKIAKDRYKGTWESGLNNKGTTGKLYGLQKSKVLTLEGCDSDSSWNIAAEDSCPNLRSFGQYIKRENRLVSLAKRSKDLPANAVVVGNLIFDSRAREPGILEERYHCSAEEE